MDWPLKHLGEIIVLVTIVASLLKRMTSTTKAQKPPMSDRPQQVDADRRVDDDDGGYDERTRRIQEEIRRKIAERRGQLAPPPVPATVSPSQPAVPTRAERDEDPFIYQRETPPTAAVAETPVIDPVLERQRLLAEQLAALELRRATVNASAQSQAAWAPAAPVAPANFNETNWLRSLRNARSLRKAVILREVIGPPVALR